MKKRLESELISIAHRVLKLKNNSDVNQLYKETQKLYETLSVLKFYQDNFESLKNSVSQEQLEEQLEEKYDAVVSSSVEEENFVEKQGKETVVEESKVANSTETIQETPEAQAETESEKEEESKPEQESEKNQEVTEQPEVAEMKVEEEVSETKSESDKEVVVQENSKEEEQDLEEEIATEESEKQDFKPNFEIEEALDSDKKETPKQISFEDFFGKDYIEPIFVKPNELIAKVESHFEEIPTDLQEYQVNRVKEEKKPQPKEENPFEKKSISLNDKFSAGINIGLNDRIAFVKKLFAGSDEDYNRVISQLNTFDTLQEAEVFIEDMVKPDYNDWSGNDEYEARFIELISKKFV